MLAKSFCSMLDRCAECTREDRSMRTNVLASETCLHEIAVLEDAAREARHNCLTMQEQAWVQFVIRMYDELSV